MLPVIIPHLKIVDGVPFRAQTTSIVAQIHVFYISGISEA